MKTGIYEQIPTSHYLQKRNDTAYYTGDYKLGLNFYSFSHNLDAWVNGKGAAVPIDTMQVIRFAKEAGFDSVDVTAYYIPGYDNFTMPTRPAEEIFDYVKKVRMLGEQLGIEISGTGVKNDFADPSDARRALDVERVKFWIDAAAVMGAPVIRVFNGAIPEDIENTTWERIAQERIVPALKACAEYGKQKGVKVGMQNHGDITSTADQIIRIMEWVDHPNLGVVNDTGCFRTFGDKIGLGYNWYDDIEAVLPYTVNFQVKKKPTAPSTDIMIDLEELFTRIRYSSYRGHIPLETLWRNDDTNHPKNLQAPPFEQVREFLEQIRAAANRTKTVKKILTS